MAGINSQANIKEKINAVRSIVPNKSNNEIVLVLQQFDYNVDKAVQAFMDGSALQVLKEWNMSGKKKNSKRKRSKSKQHHYSKDMKDKDEEAEKVSLESQELHRCHLNCCDKEAFPSKSASEKSKVVLQEEKSLEYKLMGEAKPEITGQKAELKKMLLEADRKYENSTELPDMSLSSRPQCNVGRPKSKTPTVKSPLSGSHLEIKPEDSLKKKGPNIEKSVKDLQRCTVSLTRYRMMIKEEVDNSVKKIKSAFAELHSCIIDREVALMAEVDKVKEEAMEILTARQKKAEELKRLTDLASQMSETQLAELRAEIKHFVSERKYDEELGRSARFSCDIEQLKTQIQQCGEISQPKNNYSSRALSSTLLQAAALYATPRIQSTSSRKSSSRVKTPDVKAPVAKVSSQVVVSTTESSPQIVSTNKQNGFSSQRRRFHAQYYGVRLNGSLKPQNASTETDQNSAKSNSRHEYRRQHHNSFRPKNKGVIKTLEQSAPAKSVDNLTCPEKKHPKHPVPGPTEARALCSNIPRVSPCNLCPPRIETSTDAPVLSVPAVTLVA
ncbi:SPATS2-like protein isoform X2 [Sphaerodactylus townsendi]|uniref:SPATS2-like protein isoform X2 n=1 Tax=Sphaerodactylus townsendi TaxID=933632 RepID=UPI00202751DB|nr:SPATS2-like protein isoform X2 [Sphaerodactylus townsendi]